MKALALAALVTVMASGAAYAAPACDSEIEKARSDWQAIHLEPTKPGAISRGVGTHAHVQAAVDSMRYHLSEAQALCKEGKDHEALLHVDVVRAFLNLPEIQHPRDHRYLFKGE